MKSYHILFSAFALVGLILFYAIWNVGLFKPVIIEQVNVPTSYLVYEKHVGPYHDVGAVFERVEKKLEEKKVACTRTFGRYYDNPDKVEQERLRADIGCILSQPLTESIEGILTEELPSFEALKGTFEGAPWLTAFKVYSTLKKQSYQRNLYVEESPVLEVYEAAGNAFKTEVYFRVGKSMPGPRATQ